MFDTSRYRDPWVLAGAMPAARIETERLVLRCWEAADAPLLTSALALSRDHILTWLPGAAHGPWDAEGIERQLVRFHREFTAGEGFVYGLFDSAETQVVGGAALMPRIGPGALEIGYWIRVDRVNRGLATEATRALTAAGLALPEVHRVEIHVSRANEASVAVPRKLGYRLRVAGDDGAEAQDPLVFAVEDAGGRGCPREP